MVGVPAPRNAGTHFIEQFGEVLDLGLHSSVFDRRFAFREAAAIITFSVPVTVTFSKSTVFPIKTALWSTGDDVAGFERNVGTQLLKSLQMQVDRPRTDRAAAGKTDLCLTESREQRAESQHARTHGFNEIDTALRKVRRYVL